MQMSSVPTPASFRASLVALLTVSSAALLLVSAPAALADHHNEAARAHSDVVVASAGDAAAPADQAAEKATATEGEEAAPPCGCGMAKKADGTCGACAAMAAIELPEETADEFIRMPCGCLKKKADL